MLFIIYIYIKIVLTIIYQFIYYKNRINKYFKKRILDVYFLIKLMLNHV
jgi:hypothetical protein